MKKNTTKLFAMLLLFALAVAAITSCGIVVSGEYRFGLATVEGSDTNIAAAVILDSSDRIALVRIDEIEDGKTTSKKTLGDKYGMLSSWGSSLAEWDDQIEIEVEADAFLYNMVRIISGTLAEVGMGRIEKESIPEIIASCDRRRAGLTAPAEGLFLKKVFFDTDFF